MKITQIKVRRLADSQTKLKGVASIVIDNLIAIHDIKLLEAENNRFLAMPSKVNKQGNFNDVVHPINQQMRTILEDLLFGAFDLCNTTLVLQLKESLDKDLFSLTIQDYDIIG